MEGGGPHDTQAHYDNPAHHYSPRNHTFRHDDGQHDTRGEYYRILVDEGTSQQHQRSATRILLESDHADALRSSALALRRA